MIRKYVSHVGSADCIKVRTSSLNASKNIPSLSKLQFTSLLCSQRGWLTMHSLRRWLRRQWLVSLVLVAAALLVVLALGLWQSLDDIGRRLRASLVGATIVALAALVGVFIEVAKSSRRSATEQYLDRDAA